MIFNIHFFKIHKTNQILCVLWNQNPPKSNCDFCRSQKMMDIRITCASNASYNAAELTHLNNYAKNQILFLSSFSVGSFKWDALIWFWWSYILLVFCFLKVSLKQYQDQENSRIQAKKELEEQLTFRPPPLTKIFIDTNALSNDCVAYETVVSSQDHLIHKTEVEYIIGLVLIYTVCVWLKIGDEFYTVVETIGSGDEIDAEDQLNHDQNDDINNYKIDLDTLDQYTDIKPFKPKKNLKYKCAKCEEQFALRVDLKVIITLLWRQVLS